MKKKTNNKHLNTENIDIDEVHKFHNTSSSWWGKNNQFKSLHKINPLRLSYILEKSNGLYNKKILDVGCGGGILSESMAQEGGKVTGIDVTKTLLKTARTHAIKNKINIKYLQQTIEKHIKKYQNYYDVITCMEVLEHVPNPLSMIKACDKALKYNGKVFFSTLNRNLKSLIYVIIGAEYIFNMLPKKTHNFNKFITPSELLNWINTTSLCEKHIIGLKYNLIFNKFYFSNDISVNYIICATHTN